MFFLAGSIVVLACVLGGFLMEGGNLLALWHPSEIIIIVGCDGAFGYEIIIGFVGFVVILC